MIKITRNTTVAPLASTIMAIILISFVPEQVSAGSCSTLPYCSGLSETSCRSTFGCTTYEDCTTYQGQYGLYNTITSTCSTYCKTNSECSGLITKEACDEHSTCTWDGDDDSINIDDDYALPAPLFGECDSIRITEGCDGTEFGTIAGLYEKTDETTEDGYPIYRRPNTGGRLRDLYYDGNGYWDVGYTLKSWFEDSTEPSEIKCWDGGYGSKKTYTYTDLSIECIKGGNKRSGAKHTGMALSGSALLVLSSILIWAF